MTQDRPGLRRILGQVVGAKVVFELGVAKPNDPVTVRRRENALPYCALGRESASRPGP